MPPGVIVGTAADILKFKAFDAPPPGDGLLTIIGKVPGEARSELLRVILSCPLLTNEVVRGTELNITKEAAETAIGQSRRHRTRHPR